jgi:hypothetical protein
MRRETASDRLRLSIDMFKFGLSVKEAQLRRDNPRLGPRAIEAKLRAWLLDKPAPGGSDLRRVAWPRSKKSSVARSRGR